VPEDFEQKTPWLAEIHKDSVREKIIIIIMIMMVSIFQYMNDSE
jgi:hypothetical protein